MEDFDYTAFLPNDANGATELTEDERKLLTFSWQDVMPAFPTVAQVKALIPPEGITVLDLVKPFRRAIVATADRQERFKKICLSIGTYNRETQLLMLKKQ
ncbi:hypothetical protein MMC19_000134 [Ptychographa xylographoides]|nr:hypothetical protein [Ptychographa xylographoides]